MAAIRGFNLKVQMGLRAVPARADFAQCFPGLDVLPNRDCDTVFLHMPVECTVSIAVLKNDIIGDHWVTITANVKGARVTVTAIVVPIAGF